MAEVQLVGTNDGEIIRPWESIAHPAVTAVVATHPDPTEAEIDDIIDTAGNDVEEVEAACRLIRTRNNWHTTLDALGFCTAVLPICKNAFMCA